MKHLATFILISASLVLSACSTFTHDDGYFHDRTHDYIYAKSLPPMATPTDVKMQGIVSYYPVAHPPKTGALTRPVSLVPPNLEKNAVMTKTSKKKTVAKSAKVAKAPV